MIWERLVDASAWVLPVLAAVIFHEIAHGWVAKKLGDDTASRAGRLTLNPMKHIDFRSTIVLPAVLWLVHSPLIFGAAKPVPVDFDRLRPKRLGMLAVAAAGPVSNILMAVVAGLMLHLELLVSPEQVPWIFENLYRFLLINCVLAVFNMIQLLPLDGGRVVYSLLRGKAQVIFGKMERIGMAGLIILLVVPTLLGSTAVQMSLATPTFWLLQVILMLTGNGQPTDVG